MLDTLHAVVTPEGVTLTLRLAGPVPRAMAWFIDFGIRLFVWFTAAGVFGNLGGGGIGLLLVATFLIMWGYGVVFEALLGATPGKLLLGLRVVRDDGTPIDWTGALVRNLLRTVDMLPFGYAFGLASMLHDRAFRRLGDLVAGSLVVHVAPLRAGGTVPAVPARALALRLSAEEQSALVGFAERYAYLTPARREELAGILTPLTGARDEEGVDRLIAHANAVLGRR